MAFAIHYIGSAGPTLLERLEVYHCTQRDTHSWFIRPSLMFSLIASNGGMEGPVDHNRGEQDLLL